MTTPAAAGEAASASPALIVELAVAYRRSMILFAATDLGLFDALAAGPLDAAAVARACGARPRGTEALLNACVAERLLERDGSRYRNTPTADTFLVRGRAGFMGDAFKYAEDLYPAWGRLAEFARTGEPPVKAEEMLGDDKAMTRHFVRAMHNRARGTAQALPHDLDLRGRRRLLDVGGGPGTYSMILCEKTPGLTAIVFDLPGVLEVTREIVAEHGCADRVGLHPGSYLTDDFPRGNDVVLLSGMMHRETPDTCRMLLRKAFAALDPGGLVVVSDVFFDDERHVSPPFAAHFALNMMLTSPHGSAHGKTEMAAWMEEAGFRDVRVRDLPPPKLDTNLFGTRP
jgi:cyclopropane fatty-acyl-phospholipid synthase-like methyltransferase